MSALLKKEGSETFSTILYSLRLPRTLAAVLAGAGLSVSGVLLQAVTLNPLASPNIIGVNSGAGFAVILSMIILPGALYYRAVFAFAGAFLTTLIIVFVASRVGTSKSTVILAGIAVTALLNGAISLMSYCDDDVMSSYRYFSVGGVSGVNMKELVLPCIIIAVCLIAARIISQKADVLCLGDSIALSLGVNVRLIRTLCLILSSACAAAAVSYAGLLGFVGLVVPHISRRLTGTSLKELLVISPLLGGTLLTLADLFGRVLLSPTEIPVGIVTSLVGAPFFFYLLVRRKRNAEI